MSTSAAQFAILVAIPGINTVGFVYYDGTQKGPKPTTVVTLNITVPTDFLYVLDFESSRKGWTITGISAVEGYPLLEVMHGPKRLSLLVLDPHKEMTTYRYYLHFKNTQDGSTFQYDPQETNVRT